MGLFDSVRTATGAARDMAASQAAADLYGSMWKPGPAAHTITPADIPGLLPGLYGLDTAMLVPAFARGMAVITGIGSGLPLRDLDPDTGRNLDGYGLTAAEAMWPGHANAELWRVTLTDLVCYGRAYWRVLAANGFGHPTAVEPVEHDRVTERVRVGQTWVDGSPVWMDTDGREHENRIIRFATGGPGALDHGWMAVRTALALESAANTYAANPLPSAALVSKGIDLTDDEAAEVLTAWETARRTRSTAYLNTQIGLETFGWNASELQLVEARSHAAVEIARVLNLDPYFCGASTGGSSVTYQNRVDLYQGLLDFTIMTLLRPIEQRLSLADIAGVRRIRRFDTGAFLRANLGERVAALTAYVGAGIISPDKAAALEPMIPKGDIPQ